MYSPLISLNTQARIARGTKDQSVNQYSQFINMSSHTDEILMTSAVNCAAHVFAQCFQFIMGQHYELLGTSAEVLFESVGC